MITTVLIDDEAPARALVQSLLEQDDRISLIATCENGFDGARAIQTLRPQLVLLDIQMPKLNGFEMLEIIDEHPVLIFITAYDQFAIQAFEANAADYLLKPYSAERFKTAIDKAIAKVNALEPAPAIDTVVAAAQSGQKTDRIVVRNGAKIIILPIDNISLFEADGDYVRIHHEGEKHLKQITLKRLEEKLPENMFVRVHRSYMLNITSIARIEAYSKDTYIAILKDQSKIPVSRTGYIALRNVLDF